MKRGIKMKLLEISIGKEFKKGLPNYSNISARCDMKWELAEGEAPDWNQMWDTVNQQLDLQASTMDPSWISTKEYKEHFTTTIKTPKAETIKQEELGVDKK